MSGTEVINYIFKIWNQNFYLKNKLLLGPCDLRKFLPEISLTKSFVKEVLRQKRIIWVLDKRK